MKSISIILILCLLGLTTQPLLGRILHEREISSGISAHNCCGECAEDCCGEQGEENEDQTHHDCSEDCTCVAHGVIVFTHSNSPTAIISATILEKTSTFYTSYQFIFPSTIWRPPQLVNDFSI